MYRKSILKKKKNTHRQKENEHKIEKSYAIFGNDYQTVEFLSHEILKNRLIGKKQVREIKRYKCPVAKQMSRGYAMGNIVNNYVW